LPAGCSKRRPNQSYIGLVPGVYLECCRFGLSVGLTYTQVVGWKDSTSQNAFERDVKRYFVHSRSHCGAGVEKMVFKVLVFLWFFKNLERSDFLVFMVFRYCCFCINYALKPYSYFFIII